MLRKSLSLTAGVIFALSSAPVWAQDGAKPAQEAGKTEVKTEAQAGPPRVELEIESGGQSWGKIVLDLDDGKAPITVNNFLQYVSDGFYDGTIFHRVMPTFMIQGGGYTPDISEKTAGLREPIKNEWRNGLKNNRGTISMARKGGDVNSATAQFFINVVDNGRLDQPQPDGAAYAVFGKVVSGMEVVDKIKDVETKNDPKLPMGKVVPVTPIIMKSVKIIGKYDRGRAAAAAEAAQLAAAEQEKTARAGQEKLVEDLKKRFAEAQSKGTKTATGLIKYTTKEGFGASPKASDKVEVHYTGWLLDGTKFDSSVDRGKPATFPLANVIKGWTEGVALMKIGEKATFVIPGELAYGAAGSPPRIPSNATLVFDIELLGIK